MCCCWEGLQLNAFKMKKNLLLEPSSRSSLVRTPLAPPLDGLSSLEQKQTHQNAGGKSISNHAQILRSAFGGRGIIPNFLDSVQQSSGRQIEIKAPRSAVRHREIIQLTPGDPVIRKTAGNRARDTSPENERRQTLERGNANASTAAGARKGREIGKKKNLRRKNGFLAEDNKDRGRAADLHMDRIPEFHSSTLKNGWQRREGPDDSFLDVSAKKRDVTDVPLHQLREILPFSPG